MLLNYHIRRLVLSLLCVGALVRLVLGGVRFAGWSTTSPHQSSNTQRTENKTTDVVIQQHSRKFLMMNILMSETCWTRKKWNKIASDIKLVFHSSTISLEYQLTALNCVDDAVCALILFMLKNWFQCLLYFSSPMIQHLSWWQAWAAVSWNKICYETGYVCPTFRNLFELLRHIFFF